jgi:nitrous oxidase accessory protein
MSYPLSAKPFWSVVRAWVVRAVLSFTLLALALSPRAATIEATDSISQALADARAGDTILARGPMVFREHLVIDKPVRLVGRNWPVLDAGAHGTPITIAASGAALTGFIIQNSGSDLASEDAAVMIKASGAQIRDCQIETDAFGIYLRAATDCVVSGNQIWGHGAVPSAKRGNGIHLWKSGQNEILNNSIWDKRDGVYLSYADDNTLSGNRIWNTRFGIHSMYSNRNRLLTNSLSRNAVGATLMFSRQALVRGNDIVANRRHGIVLKQLDSSRIEDNTVCGQNRGLFVEQSAQNRFERNLVATNDIGLYLSGGSEQNVFVGNSFVQNADQVWQPPFETEQGQAGSNRFYEKGRGNYWSDYAGTDANQDGVGDTPYHETDVFGYILDRHPAVRLLALSPAIALLRKSEELFPLLDLGGVTDLYPLMQAVHRLKTKAR